MNKKKLRNFARSALLAVVGLAVGIQLYRWNASSLAGNLLPMPFGVGTAVVMSGSMEPTICTNDLILVRAADSYEVGEIVVYQSSSALVVHRIIQTDGEIVVTQGDANNVADDPIRAETIKGKVVTHFPNAGSYVLLLKSPAVTLCLIGGAVLLLESSYRKDKKKDQEDIERIKEEIRRLKEQ